MFDSKNLIILFIIIAALNMFSGSFDLKNTILMLPGLIIALSFHEYAHARKAVKLGDPTPDNQGRLTLSPFAHMDPIGTICLLFAGFGWGKPVQINPANFENPERDSAKVAFAGPLMNFILALVFAVIYAIAYVVEIKAELFEVSVDGVTLNSACEFINSIIVNAMCLNIGLGLFNLLPFPPLDGSKIYRYFLRGNAKKILYKMEQYSWIFIAIIFATHITSYILTPLMNGILNYILLPIINFIVKIGLS